jgi:hypothetical protein
MSSLGDAVRRSSKSMFGALHPEADSSGNEPPKPEEERELQLYDVIQEEYDRIDGIALEKPHERSWIIRPEHIRDVPDLARKLYGARTPIDVPASHVATASDATREISRALLGLPFNGDPAPQAAAPGAGGETDVAGVALASALEAYVTPDHSNAELEERLREQIALRMSQLLDREDLWSRPGFRSLTLNAHADDLRSAQAVKPYRTAEPNRLMFEAAYPAQLIKVRDLILGHLYARANEKRYAALCISGGGIRSATFGLGVVQGLARTGLLQRFHYMSTVSGEQLEDGPPGGVAEQSQTSRSVSVH